MKQKRTVMFSQRKNGEQMAEFNGEREYGPLTFWSIVRIERMFQKYGENIQVHFQIYVDVSADFPRRIE